jgi:hypothetical protein
MTPRFVLALCAGALVGGAAGWQSQAEATSCGCFGESLHLELVSGPDVPCADGSCDSEWVQAPVLQKSDGGISGDLVHGGWAYLVETEGGE